MFVLTGILLCALLLQEDGSGVSEVPRVVSGGISFPSQPAPQNPSPGKPQLAIVPQTRPHPGQWPQHHAGQPRGSLPQRPPTALMENLPTAAPIPNNPFPVTSTAPNPNTQYPPAQRQYWIAPTYRPPKAATQPPPPKPPGPRQPSVYEASGPLFGELDPLVQYQREQAEKGNPQSQYALGMRYLSGAGVIQNNEIALEWLRKASANGELRARAKLREMRRERQAQSR